MAVISRGFGKSSGHHSHCRSCEDACCGRASFIVDCGHFSQPKDRGAAFECALFTSVSYHTRESCDVGPACDKTKLDGRLILRLPAVVTRLANGTCLGVSENMIRD